ncbi:MAG: hypothetical protein IKA90_06530 [Clostridia bacterium]|nr:hypothetical protein [Clostridia bacterium]
MIDFAKYIKDKDDLAFITEISQALENQNEIPLSFKEKSFSIEPTCGQIWVYENIDTSPLKFADFEDFCFNYRLDGKPFIEQISLVEDADF